MECGGKVAFGGRDTALAETRFPPHDAQDVKNRPGTPALAIKGTAKNGGMQGPCNASACSGRMRPIMCGRYSLPVRVVLATWRERLAPAGAGAADLLEQKMHAVGHPFILGSECDILSVPGCKDTITRKVDALINGRCCLSPCGGDTEEERAARTRRPAESALLQKPGVACNATAAATRHKLGIGCSVGLAGRSPASSNWPLPGVGTPYRCASSREYSR
ncbi:MAG: hypothetical protein A3K18_17470 [Lentisphaerae bacterium RIFOXYA12_64_32]|nr:MAG: hypothetical protein A3K18_17470 [Lentisphaerae bacterium RIFOXYA12_64_32]